MTLCRRYHDRKGSSGNAGTAARSAGTIKNMHSRADLPERVGRIDEFLFFTYLPYRLFYRAGSNEPAAA
jgi:hypothetical protein